METTLEMEIETIVEQAKQEAVSLSDRQLADKLTEDLIGKPLVVLLRAHEYAREAAERLREYADERSDAEQAYLDSLDC